MVDDVDPCTKCFFQRLRLCIETLRKYRLRLCTILTFLPSHEPLGVMVFHLDLLRIENHVRTKMAFSVNSRVKVTLYYGSMS